MFPDTPLPHPAAMACRIAYRLVQLDFRQHRDAWAYPHQALRALTRYHYPYCGGLVALALAGLHYDFAYHGRTLSEWKQDVLRRAARGDDFRSCFFPAYKSHRRGAYPRVTNRGVSSDDRAGYGYLAELVREGSGYETH